MPCFYLLAVTTEMISDTVRLTSRATIKVLIEDPAFEDERGAFTKNVVYKDVLRLRQ